MKLLKELMIFTALFCKAHPLSSMDYAELREYEKTSLVMTGSPLSAPLKNQIIAGKMNKDQLIRQLLKSDPFIKKMALFWSSRMGMSAAVRPWTMMKKGATQTAFYYLSESKSGIPNINLHRKTEPTAAFIRNSIEAMKNYQGYLSVDQKTCNVSIKDQDGNQKTSQMIWLTSPDFVTDKEDLDRIIKTGEYRKGTPSKIDPGLYKELKDLLMKIDPSCDQIELTSKASPYYAKEIPNEIRIATFLAKDTICGKNGDKCWSKRAVFPTLQASDLMEDSTMEPGYIIAKTIADQSPFEDILTTTKTILTGRYAYYLQHWQPFWDNYPDGKYQENTEARWIHPSWEDSSLFWVERGPQEAGVLTTMAWSFLTNGRRAKANKAYETFACRSFTVPEGAVPDPSDANPDLRERQYCSYCHRTLEPMAAFFNRWPATGRVNHEFYRDQDINDTGEFRGQRGKGVRAFAEILSKTEDFKNCSIQHAFNFVYGRGMGKSEADVYLPKYREIYESTHSRLDEVIRSMLLDKLFTESQEAKNTTQTDNAGDL
ncbi:MAG: hypothetical protein H6618_03580 [Deltaproteobacteria bacterium]|nr:hypothetical protein [Deltaproteobacteria bacterium]